MLPRLLSLLIIALLATGCVSQVRNFWPVANDTLQPADFGLAGLARLREGRSMRASSSADGTPRYENADAFSIAPGQTLVLAELQGPGQINHIWNTIASPEQGYSRLLRLRMYWDGEEHPSVDVPIGDFFGVGHGIDDPFQSLPVSVTSNGKARNCFWPMPFAHSARITVTNEGNETASAFYYYIDWHKLPRLPPNTAYFHAMYRQEFPCQPGNYMLADIDGRGHYVGTVLSIRADLPSWYGEGDDFFYIDGESSPSLKGTGTEDYFCDAWGFREFDAPYYGAPLVPPFEAGNKHSVYRWHITDPIVFTQSLYAEIEHKGFPHYENGKVVEGYGERMDDYSSVAFWYQTEPHKPFPSMPVGYERLYPPLEQEIQSLWNTEVFTEGLANKTRQRLRTYAVQMPSGIHMLPTEPSKTIELKLVNEYAEPFTVSGQLPPSDGVNWSPSSICETLPPQSEKTFDLTFSLDPSVPWPTDPLELDWSLRFEPEGFDPVTVEVTNPFHVIIPESLPQTETSIQVDGDLADWPELRYDVRQPEQVRDVTDLDEWTGPQDCHFKFDLRYDAQYLYVAVQSHDDQLILRPDAFPWVQDGIEIRIDARPDPERSAGAEDFGEFDQFLFFSLSPPALNAEMVSFQPQRWPEGAQAVCVRTPDGFNTEVAVPVEVLNHFQGEPWQYLRVNICQDDIDDPRQDVSVQIWWRPDWRLGESYDASGTFIRTE